MLEILRPHVTAQQAPWLSGAGFRVQQLAHGIRKHGILVEIDEAFIAFPPVCIVAAETGDTCVEYVPLMGLEALVIQDTVPCVAVIAQLIGERALRP